MNTLSLLTRSALLLALLLTACSAPPTPDPRLQYTIVAGTVQAQLTLAAAAAPPTATRPPTATPTPLIVSTITLPPTAVLPTQPVRTATLAGPVTTSADKAAWVSNTPADGSSVAPGAGFTTTWVVTNTGPTTWTTKYTLRFFSGTSYGSTNITFPNDVKPGERVSLTMAMVSPAAEGSYNGTWVLTNDQGQNFYSVTLPLIVGSGAATATVTVTGTPATATATSTGPTATSGPTRTPTSPGPTLTPTRTPTVSDKPPGA